MQTIQPLLARTSLLPNESLYSFLIRLVYLNSYVSPNFLWYILSKELDLQEYPKDAGENINFPLKAETYSKISSLTLIDPLTLYRSTYQRFALVLTPPPRSINHLALPDKTLMPCFSTFHAHTQIRPTNISQFCPMCLNENPYYPLSWIPVALSACLRHKCLLTDRCPACGQEVSQYAVITTKCNRCNGDLTKAKVISIADDEIGLCAQQMLQSWFMDYVTPEQETSKLPPQDPVLLYRIIEGLQNSIETEKNGEWFYLHYPSSHRDKLTLTLRKEGKVLTPYKSYCTYSTACKAIMNWPESFFEFLHSYCNNSSGQSQNNLLTGSPLNNLGVLYTRWQKKQWSYAEFRFVQEIFDNHIINDYWLSSCSIRTKFYKKRSDAAEHSKHIDNIVAANFLKTSPEVIKLLQRNKLLTQVSEDQHELVDKQEILYLHKAWNSLITLKKASMLLGLTEKVTIELVILGILAGEHNLKHSMNLQYRISEVMVCLEMISRYVHNYSSQEFVKKGSWDDLTRVDHIFCKESFSAVTILLQVMEGNLTAFHPLDGKFQLKSLLFASQDIKNCIERLKNQSMWLERKEVLRLLGIKDSSLLRWIRNGRILPIAICKRDQYFDAEKVHRLCSKYVTQEEAACILTVSISTLQNWIYANQVPELLINDPSQEGEGACIFDKEQLIQWRNDRFTSDEAVQALGVTKTTLYRWVKEGKLRPLDTIHGNQYLFLKQDILKLKS